MSFSTKENYYLFPQFKVKQKKSTPILNAQQKTQNSTARV